MKSPLLHRLKFSATSPPSRGAWIEIVDLEVISKKAQTVAPLAGGVD